MAMDDRNSTPPAAEEANPSAAQPSEPDQDIDTAGTEADEEFVKRHGRQGVGREGQPEPDSGNEEEQGGEETGDPDPLPA
jgi:hypothetical protein